MHTLKALVKAIEVANPFILGMRYEDGFNKCIEASISGAQALRRFGLDAKPVQCCLLAQNLTRSVGLTMGLTKRQLYALSPPSQRELLSFEEWVASTPTRTMPGAEHQRPHMVIVATHKGEHAMIDLTVGQIRDKGFAVTLQLSNLSKIAGWPELELKDGTVLNYIDYSGPPLDMSKYSGDGMADDYHNMMEYALANGLDFDRLGARLAQVEPHTHAACMTRLQMLVESYPF